MSQQTTDYQVGRPDRQPDYVSRVGHAFWWAEMVFMHVHGGFFRISVDQEDSSLYVTMRNQKIKLPDKSVYDEWVFNTFESKFFGDDNG